MTTAAIHSISPGFEQLYPALRQKEGRVYTDEEVLHLPDITKTHPHYPEWELRKRSCSRLKQYIEKRPASPVILEVGCGNGWLACQLAEIPGSDVTGIDINFTELQQAIRVFGHIPYLQFIQGGITAKEIEDVKYDLIVFAASIQYFSPVEEIIRQAQRKLKTNGEIHILDSPFYRRGGMDAAEKRTRDYYDDLGFPGMAQHYFHHTWDDIASFRYKVLYRPSFINHHFFNNTNPFPWLSIKKQA